MECEDFAMAKKILRELLVICQSENENKVVIDSAKFIEQQSQENQTENTAYEEESDENLFEDTLFADDNEPDDNGWLDELSPNVDKNKKNVENGVANWLFLPALHKNIVSMAKRLPLWSAVLKNAFKSSLTLQNQGNAEAAFNVIKNVIFSNVRLPIRADDFVKNHLNSIQGFAKHMLTKQIGEAKKEASEEKVLRSPDPEENWKNKTKQAKRKDLIKIRLQQEVPHVQMMSNTFLDRRRRQAPYFTNMCTFNSVLHALSCAYMDSVNLKEYLDEVALIEDERKAKLFVCVLLNYFQPDIFLRHYLI